MLSSPPKPHRPVGVTIIAIVAVAGGLLSLFGGASILAGNVTGPFVLAIIVILFGVLGLALGVGFYTGPRWALTAGIVVYAISIGLGVAELFYGGMVGFLGGITRIVAGILIPVYLTRKGPKTFFGSARVSLGPQT